LRSGEILGLIDLRDNVIKSYMNQLDQIAMTIAKEVNAVHKNGYDVASENERGHLFFDEKLTGAKDFKLNKIIQDDPGKIATSLTGAVGDNQTALNIANLKFSKLINNDTSIVQSYSNLVYDIGKDVAYMKSKQENMELTVNQVNKFREAVKGVSLNEETADLIKYQQMYQAAAKIISVADDMFKVVLGLV
jgi:flagellar hook-associated protein 1 FlgK